MVHSARARTLMILLALGVLLVLAGCGAESDGISLAPASMLPDFASQAPPRVRDAYRYAIAHHDELEHYPCYCGCGAMGHTSNLSCYIQDIGEDSTIIFDTHAIGCGICVDITQDVMRLNAEGRSAQEIRAYIDSTYSAYGPSTDTPLP
ncbi:MAG: PCYCGC motif-containing (lipo)protein [Aggregatilineales bacterium]|nr:hypothetical protein [Chloroflexota bacterium]HOA25644.1 PCYCGC motif-containing (lipo)protein [Aggregatilineales bacterium]HPV05577.1 PCYCGC motif-containing (lipo)protein [Aggregatilineales bacterium]